MKKGLSATDSPDEKNFNPILAFDSELFKDKLKELAIIVALKEVAKQNNLSLKDSIKIEIPENLNQFKKDLVAMHNLEIN